MLCMFCSEHLGRWRSPKLEMTRGMSCLRKCAVLRSASWEVYHLPASCVFWFLNVLFGSSNQLQGHDDYFLWAKLGNRLPPTMKKPISFSFERFQSGFLQTHVDILYPTGGILRRCSVYSGGRVVERGALSQWLWTWHQVRSLTFRHKFCLLNLPVWIMEMSENSIPSVARESTR